MNYDNKSVHHVSVYYEHVTIAQGMYGQASMKMNIIAGVNGLLKTSVLRVHNDDLV